ncbi:hypothetical protein HaLaN_16565 [Haematococcus lacustris]|uniref:Uncharacterized protein n=1 Tax=Haematococcus lacustris TaxID=44745 RepID=A0A699ZM59_HAELA|nr:hypothetical protein HaLaN_16565 [Haematococcus lacustris]
MVADMVRLPHRVPGGQGDGDVPQPATDGWCGGHCAGYWPASPGPWSASTGGAGLLTVGLNPTQGLH